MPFVAGTFVRTQNYTNDAAAHLPADAAKFDTDLNDFATGMGQLYAASFLAATTTNGFLPIGNGTGITYAALTAGTNVTVTNGAGSITIAAPNVMPLAGGTFTGAVTFSGTSSKINTIASATTGAGINLPHGAAPTSPVNGDVWTDATNGLVVRINGATKALAGAGANTDITSLITSTSLVESGTISSTTLGFRGLPLNAKTGAYTFALTDAGKCIPNTTGGWVIPANASIAFPTGTFISGYNDSGLSQTLSITTDTLTQAVTGSTGSRTIAARGAFTVWKIRSTEWIVWGSGIS